MKYIGFYAPEGVSSYSRTANLASQSKMDYIIYLLNELGFDVEVVSPSWITEKRRVREKKTTHRLSGKNVLTLAPSFSSKNKLLRFFAIAFSLVWLTFYLLKHTTKGESIIAYHVQWTAYPLVIAKRIKKLNLILEVEEIYQQIWKNKKVLNKMENKVLKNANAYIVSTELLLDSLPSKQNVTILGNYSVNSHADYEIQNDVGKIRLVYAGVIDSVKGGACIAVNACLFLPALFELKIIGFGSDSEIQKLKHKIDEINDKLGRQAAEYCGVKRGDEYNNFMMNNDVGLNPQMISDFDRVEFPSKVISYMSFGMNVVSTPLACLIRSGVSDVIEFSKDDSPESFAAAIIAATENKKESRIQRLDKLHREAINGLRSLLEVN